MTLIGIRWLVNLKSSGAGWTQGSLGFLPRRRKLKVVMGKPIEVGVLEQYTFHISTIVEYLLFKLIMLLFLKHFSLSSPKWRRQALRRWTLRTSNTWLPLPRSTSSTILTKTCPWSSPEINVQVFRLQYSVFPYAKQWSMPRLSPCNLQLLVLHFV